MLWYNWLFLRHVIFHQKISAFTAQTKLDPITGIDKVVHVCMYLGLELIIWIEYLRHHENLNWVKIIILGIFAPIALGGLMEIAQMELTQSRSGEWADLWADTIGVLAGAAIGYFAIQTVFKKKR